MALNSLLSGLHRDNRRMLGKLAVVALAMFGFGYALVPMYRTICDALGINVLSVSERVTSAGLASSAQRQLRPSLPAARPSMAASRMDRAFIRGSGCAPGTSG